MTDPEFEVYWALRLKFVDRPEARIFSERMGPRFSEPKHTLFHVVEEKPGGGVAHARVKLYTDFQKVRPQDAARLASKARMQMAGQGLSIAAGHFAKAARAFNLQISSAFNRASRVSDHVR